MYICGTFRIHKVSPKKHDLPQLSSTITCLHYLFHIPRCAQTLGAIAPNWCAPDDASGFDGLSRFKPRSLRTSYPGATGTDGLEATE